MKKMFLDYYTILMCGNMSLKHTLKFSGPEA